MRLVELGLGDVILVDITKGLARGKALDLEDAAAVLRYNYSVQGTDEIASIKGSDIIVVTAGLARRPGMTREDLLNKNAQILKDICLEIKNLSSNAIVIVVTNPLDLMAHLALKVTGFKAGKVFGMGVSLDAARFTNLISKELKAYNTDIEACVIGSHGEGMLPLPRFTTVKGIDLTELLDDARIKALVKRTQERGQEIVSLLASGSAYFAPSQAIAAIVKTIVKDEKRTIGLSAYLSGEYATKDICIGVPCRIGKKGIEKVIEFELNNEEQRLFLNSVESIRNNLELIKPYFNEL